MTKRVVFFNHFHNGDIHVSRGLVRQVMGKLRQKDPSIQFVYAHKNAPDTINDIPGLLYDRSLLSLTGSEHTTTSVRGDTAYFNTWYGQDHFKHLNRYGLTFDALYSCFDDNCKSLWKFSLDSISTSPSDFFPIIDYTRYHIGPAQNWLKAWPTKKIFVSNGAVLSDQAYQFPLTPIISDIASRHPDKIFILSNQDGHPGSTNIAHSSNIIRKAGNDLNENSFIASHCDVIIGKASGSFTFAMTQENLFHRNTKILALCNLVPVPPNRDFWIGEMLRDKIHYQAQVIVSNESDTARVSKLIEDNI